MASDLNAKLKISENSKEISKGSIFVAIKGTNSNGEDYIQDAINNGATEIIVAINSTVEVPKNIKLIKVPNTRLYLSHKSSELYPSQPKYLTAVTGTSGKTSVAFFFKEICKLLGLRSASIGTLGVLSDNLEISHSEALTSPSAPLLHKTLNELTNNGIEHICVEASSHGLDQYRVSSLNLKAAAFTNFSRDHLDYHGDMENYFQAKLKLFTEVLKGGTAVLNADISHYPRIKEKCKNILSYGENGEDVKLLSNTNNTINISLLGHNYSVQTVFVNSFQKFNLLAAIGLVLACGIEAKKIINVIPKLKLVPGRMHLAGINNGAEIYVDYAHKPDALEVVLKSLRQKCEGNLKIVFGCGGDRDKGKRPLMGEIACKYADMVIVTDDNPRTENPSQIRSQIIQSCPNAIEIANRSSAIAFAIESLKPKDILLIAGKGHEEYQIYGKEKRFFSDFEEVQKVLNIKT